MGIKTSIKIIKINSYGYTVVIEKLLWFRSFNFAAMWWNFDIMFLLTTMPSYSVICKFFEYINKNWLKFITKALYIYQGFTNKYFSVILQVARPQKWTSRVEFCRFLGTTKYKISGTFGGFPAYTRGVLWKFLTGVFHLFISITTCFRNFGQKDTLL